VRPELVADRAISDRFLAARSARPVRQNRRKLAKDTKTMLANDP